MGTYMGPIWVAHMGLKWDLQPGTIWALNGQPIWAKYGSPKGPSIPEHGQNMGPIMAPIHYYMGRIWVPLLPQYTIIWVEYRPYNGPRTPMPRLNMGLIMTQALIYVMQSVLDPK